MLAQITLRLGFYELFYTDALAQLDEVMFGREENQASV
jgi:hypothetical protein